MKIHNTVTRRLEEFEPIERPHVRMYTCGPTVYDYAHIGNFRTYVFEDILRRQFKAMGFDVTQAMNLTDIDDKTMRGAREAGVTLREFTSRYIDAFFQDLDVLNIERAEVYPAATEHIDEMIKLIAVLLEKGHAYQSEDGSVYYNIGSFERYGRLAHLDMAGLKPGARVAQDEYEKEQFADFALWKAWSEEDGDVAWDSPWGRGRPGWHIECSAMSMKYLGESFDIHTGGVDNIFPHHENEIAQSEGATGKPFVKYWLHSAHLRVEGRKMSKSLGNFYTLRDILAKGYTGREIRFVLLSGHYRQSFNFTFAAADSARAALARLDDFSRRLTETADAAVPKENSPEWVVAAYEGFRSALAEDLAISEALSALFDMVHTGNRLMDKGDVTSSDALAALGALAEFDRVLGVLRRPEDIPPQEVQDLARQRAEARARRDWAEADRIRDELAEIGWEIRDTAQGRTLVRR